MRLCKNILCLSFFIFVSIVNSLSEEVSDTMKVYYLKPVIVTATRSEILLEKSPVYSHIITREQISNFNSRTIADVLMFSEGIFIRDYGQTGGLKTISIRGTSVENNLILINGMRINNFQNGLVDLSLLNSDIIEKIEIVHGGNTALYGADAVGSVINILTLNPLKKMNAGFAVSKGSFDYNRLLLSLSNATENLGASFAFVREYGKDNYKFKLPFVNDFGERQNAEFSRNNYYLSNFIKKNNLSFRTYATYTHSDRNLPGSLSFPSTTSSQNDRNFYLQVLTKYQYSENLYFEINNGWNYSFQKYREPVFNISSFSKNTQISINPQVFYKFTEGKSLVFGIEYAKGTLKGTDYISSVYRSQKSIYLTGMFLFEIDKMFLNNLSVYPSLRYDKYDNIGSEFSPKLGLNFEIIKALYLKTSYGQNYRVPTLNELFYIDAWGNKGNPNLKPEYSRSVDAGLTYSFYWLGNINFEYSYFYIDTKDKIIWKEIQPYIYSPKNVDKILSKGSILSFDYELKNYRISMNYTLTDSRKVSKSNGSDPTYNKYIIYTPKHMWKFNLNGRYKMLAFGLNHIIVSNRYTDEENINKLPEYHLTNGNIGLNYNTNFGRIYLKLEVNNIFNRSFQIIKDYPMPLRNYKVSLGLDY